MQILRTPISLLGITRGHKWCEQESVDAKMVPTFSLFHCQSDLEAARRQKPMSKLGCCPLRVRDM